MFSANGKSFQENKEYYSSLFMTCSECGKGNNSKNSYCIHCGHKLKKIPKNAKNYKEYCVHCGEQLKKNDIVCGKCHFPVRKEKKKRKVCAVCGEWCDDNKYCWNCGHDNYRNINLVKIFCGKKCPNCNSYYDSCFSYCDECGTKLEKKKGLL